MYRKDQFPLIPNKHYIVRENAAKNLLELLVNLSIINLDTSVEDVVHGYVNRVTGLMFYVPEKE